MSRFVTLTGVSAALSLLLAGAALAQTGQPLPDGTVVPGHGAPVTGAVPHGHPPLPTGDGHALSRPSLGYEPILLEIGDGERISLPRSYDQTPCADEVVRRIFTGEITEEFVASLRCWRVPFARSSEFVQALDQAIPAAGWTFLRGAAMGTHYSKGEDKLDVLIFGFDRYEADTYDVGYLFGVYQE